MQVSIVLPIMDETWSLRETVRILMDENAGVIGQIIVIGGKRTTPESLASARELAAQHPELITIEMQRLPFLGGALRDAFDCARGTHVVMMASDLETDPHEVKALVAAADGYDIVTGTRWKGHGDFHGYSPVKYVGNWVFQKMLSLLYATSLSDLTYAYRIYRMKWVKEIEWEELRHPFLLESLIKPLRLGATVKELPMVWKARSEGDSHNPFWQNFLYFRTALKVRFASRKSLLREQPTGAH